MNEKREAELRRLQDRLLDRITTAEDQAERAVAGCERLRAQRDALLEALKEADDYTRHPDYDWPVEFSRRVSDAIKKAEGGQ